MYHQIKEEGFATPVQVLMDLHILSKEDYERWRNGKIDYLERICKINLSKLNFILHEIQSYGKQHGLKESVTFYKQWGRKGKAVKLRFTKMKNEAMEKKYATHYVAIEKS